MSFVDAKKKAVLCRLEVLRTQRLSPNFVRITVGGDDLAQVEKVGHDHWFRLFLPQEEGETSFDLPSSFDLLGYLAYLRMPGATRPVQRNYTVREFRPESLELDIDFVVHGDEGAATRWATRTQPGDRIAIIDQGTGFDTSATADEYLLVADETGLPAVAGILRDLPRDARGLAIIEVPDAADAQDTDAPDGFEVRYVARPHGARPGATALDEAKTWTRSGEAVSVYVVGEQQLPTQLRRWLVSERDVPKKSIVFSGYWRLGKS